MSINKHICRKKIVVLLGAGAAIPWGGVSTKELTNRMKDDTTYMYDAGITFGQHIFDTLTHFYNRDCANFETFLAVVEEIYNYIINQTNTGGINEKNTAFIPAIFNLYDNISKYINNQAKEMKKQSTILPDIETAKRVYLGDMFYYYINQIINIICKYNENAKQKHDLNHKLYEFTKYFINKGYAVKFYTTNYDSIVPQALSTYFRNINIYDGLLPPDINNIKQFNHDLHLFKIARLSYFNLHGSIFWRNIFNNNSIPHYEVSYYDKVDNLKYAQANKGGNPNQPLIFTPIITGYNKTQRMSSFPFNIGFNAFVNDCHDCTTILVVGYSFSDPHINCILSTFVDWRKTKFALITTSISEQDKYEIENITNTYLPCIKTIDWLHYNGSYNHIYILGYEYFLADKSNWKYLL